MVESKLGRAVQVQLRDGRFDVETGRRERVRQRCGEERRVNWHRTWGRGGGPFVRVGCEAGCHFGGVSAWCVCVCRPSPDDGIAKAEVPELRGECIKKGSGGLYKYIVSSVDDNKVGMDMAARCQPLPRMVTCILLSCLMCLLFNMHLV